VLLLLVFFCFFLLVILYVITLKVRTIHTMMVVVIFPVDQSPVFSLKV